MNLTRNGPAANRLEPKASDQDSGFESYLFYDIEVFSQYALAIFKKADKSTFAVFEFEPGTERERSEELRALVSSHILVGYNNYFYDDFILTLMMQGASCQRLKDANDRIIQERQPPVQADTSRIVSLDAFQQIDPSRPSLKAIEANLGLDIRETSVAFDFDERLSESQKEDTIFYCSTDIDATVDVFMLRWHSYFVPKLGILQLLEEPGMARRALRWNTTTITGNVLTQARQKHGWGYPKVARWSWERIVSGDYPVDYEKVPPEVAEVWRTCRDGKGKVLHTEFGCEMQFGFGGLHGANSKLKKFSDVKLLDAASMYPNIIINGNVLGRSTAAYERIVRRRLEAKKSDPVLAAALKLIVNATYGLMGNEYSKVYNPNGKIYVCLYGQMALYNLCKRLYQAGYTIVNINTDGIAFCGGPNGAYEQIQKEWEKEFGLRLELDEFSEWHQKDVNSYIAVRKDGRIKAKGADVKKAGNPVDFSGDLISSFDPGEAWYRTNSLQIVSEAVVNYVVHGKRPVDTVIENRDKPIMYQQVLKAGRTFRGVIDDDGNRDYQKVNRIFACRKGAEGAVRLKKERPDGGVVLFPDTPETMMVHNGPVGEIEGFKENIDIGFYLSLAEKACERWI